MTTELKEAVVPARVLYNADLPPAAKLCYGVLNVLATGKGYCWASDTWLAYKFQVDEKTVAKWLRDLSKAGYLRIEAYVADGVRDRQITVVPLDERPRGYQ